MTCEKEHKAPIVVSTGICSNIFQWATPLACNDDERVDMCAVRLSDRQLSLSVLQRVSGKVFISFLEKVLTEDIDKKCSL